MDTDLDNLPTVDQVLEAQLQDPEFRAEWERTALARAVANTVVRYRTDQDLSQRELAQLLGWKQSQVARLELGEHNPSIETLVHLVRKLGLSITVDLEPANTPSRVRRHAAEHAVVQDVTWETGGGHMTIVTAQRSPKRRGSPARRGPRARAARQS